MQNRFGGLPNSTIAVGHSLGGLVAREWTRSHELDGLITIGTPNRGAPIANHINEWVGFNASLFNAVGNAFYGLSGLSYDQWWWVPGAVEGALNWGASIADFSIAHLLIELGMQYSTPFVQEVYVGSPVPQRAQRRRGLGGCEHSVPGGDREHRERVLAWRTVPVEESRLRRGVLDPDQHGGGGPRLLGLPGHWPMPIRWTTMRSPSPTGCSTRRSTCGTSTSSGVAPSPTTGRSGRGPACRTTGSFRRGASSTPARSRWK